MKIFQSFVLLAFLLFFSFESKAQILENLLDFMTVCPNKQAVSKDPAIYPAKAIFTPVISYAPETNLSFGVGMKGLFKLKGSGAETRTSNVPLSVQYTIENKYLFFSGFDVFFPQEKYRLSGNVRIQSFPSLYFGIGEDTPDSNEEEFAYSQILIEPIFMKNLIMPNLFFGLGPRYNRISNIEAKREGLLELSEHSGSNGSTSSGLQLAVIFDSRDNVLNANEGMYVEFTHGFYEKLLGGTQVFQLTRFDLRYYMKVLKKPASILAFQFTAHFTSGNTPLIELGRLGGDDIMRGYFEGRYTERHLLATQVEWRQNLNHRWGVVAFGGIGTVASSIDQFDLDHIRPSVGLGLRFLVDSEENLNLRFDFGRGQRKSNFYVKIAEAF